MRFALCSDLHLECNNLALSEIEWPEADVLLLAGDIFNLPTQPSGAWKLKEEAHIVEFFEFVSHRYSKVFMVMGNHEYWYQAINNAKTLYQKYLQAWPNIRILEDEVVDLGELLLVGSTLWTDYNNHDNWSMYLGNTRMPDTRLVYKWEHEEMVVLRAEDYLAKHKHSVKFIDHVCSTSKKPIVVMTHHAPSFKSVHPRFAGHSLNGCFMSDVEWLMHDRDNIVAWCHGHLHNPSLYKINNAKVICAPRGHGDEDFEKEAFKVQSFSI